MVAAKPDNLNTPTALGFPHLRRIASKPVTLASSKSIKRSHRIVDICMGVAIAGSSALGLWLASITTVVKSEVDLRQPAEPSLFDTLGSPEFQEWQRQYAITQAQEELAAARIEADAIVADAETAADSISAKASETASDMLNDAWYGSTEHNYGVLYATAEQVYQREPGTIISVNFASVSSCTEVAGRYVISAKSAGANKTFYGAASCIEGSVPANGELGKAGRDPIGVSG